MVIFIVYVFRHYCLYEITDAQDNYEARNSKKNLRRSVSGTNPTL